jgi:hypothetical protein
VGWLLRLVHGNLPPSYRQRSHPTKGAFKIPRTRGFQGAAGSRYRPLSHCTPKARKGGVRS